MMCRKTSNHLFISNLYFKVLFARTIILSLVSQHVFSITFKVSLIVHLMKIDEVLYKRRKSSKFMHLTEMRNLSMPFNRIEDILKNKCLWLPILTQVDFARQSPLETGKRPYWAAINRPRGNNEESNIPADFSRCQ